MERKKTLEYLVGMTYTTAQFVSVLYVFDAFFERRYGNKVFWSISTIWIFVSFLILNIEGSTLSFIKIFLVPFLFWIMNRLLYQSHWVQSIFISTMVYAVFNGLGYILEILVALKFNLKFHQLIHNRILYTIIGGISTLIILLISITIRRYRTPITNSVSNRRWMLLSTLFPLSSMIILLLLYILIESERSNHKLMLLCISLMIIENIVVIFFIDHLQQSTREHEALVMIQEKERIQEESLHALSLAYESQRKSTHDFRKHISTISTLISKNQVKIAQEYINQLIEHQTERILLVNTHNSTIDAVLNQKGYLAKQYDIDMRFEVNDLSGIKMKSIDCTILLGNLLDNAIEACNNLKEREKWIQVSVIRDFEILFISVLNPSVPVKIINNEIASTKENPSFHGFGIRNIKDILHKYNAEYIMTYDDGCFLFSIECPDI